MSTKKIGLSIFTSTLSIQTGDFRLYVLIVKPVELSVCVPPRGVCRLCVVCMVFEYRLDERVRKIKGFKYEILASYLEIYREKIMDLLNPSDHHLPV
eukprot:1392080-Amorphochlora_amoeboformis.AAC.1